MRGYLVPAGIAAAIAIFTCASLAPVVLSTEYGPAVPIVRWFSLPTLMLPSHIALRAHLIGIRRLRLLLVYRALYASSFLVVLHTLTGTFGPVSVPMGLLAALSFAPPIVAMIRRHTVTGEESRRARRADPPIVPVRPRSHTRRVVTPRRS